MRRGKIEIHIKHPPSPGMQDALTRPDLLQTVANDVDAERLAMLRLVSRGTRQSVDVVRGARRVQLTDDWWDAQDGTRAEKTAALAQRLAELAATRPVVGWLELRHTDLNGTEPGLLALLTANTALTRLVLDENGIRGHGMLALQRALRQCAALTYLDVSSNDLSSARGARALGRLLGEHPGLLQVDLANCNLRGEAEPGGQHAPADVAAGLRACTGLTHLNLGVNFRQGGVQRILPAIGTLHALTELRLTGCRVWEQGNLHAALVQCRALRLVDLADCDLLGGLLHRTWPQLPALEGLDVSHNNAGDEHMRALAEALPRCLRLQKLRLRNNILGPAATAELAFALPLCRRLVNLDVRECRHVRQVGFVGFVQLEPEALETLQEAWAAPHAGGFVRWAAWLQA